MTQAHDYSAFDDQPASSDKLAQLQQLAKDHRAAQLEVIKCETALLAADKKLRDYAENLIPSAMEDLSLKSFTTDTGIVISIKEQINASIPDELKPRAFIWLRENNHGALIKHEIKMDFSMGEDEKAVDLMKRLTDEGYAPEEKESVHASTLKAFVTEMLTKGEDLPDAISVHRRNVADMKIPGVANVARIFKK